MTVMTERVRSRNFLAAAFTMLVVLGLMLSVLLTAKNSGTTSLASGYGYGTFPDNGTTTGGVSKTSTHRVWNEVNCNRSNVATHTIFTYGLAGDRLIPGAWNGNGTVTAGVRRGNTWYLRNSNNGGTATYTFPFGLASDTPLAGDWNGGTVNWNPGVHRPGTNKWYLRNSKSGGSANIAFRYGSATDTRFFAGDWDGNGTFTPGVRRGSTFYLRNSNSSGPADIIVSFGVSTDQGLVGDWNSDGVFTVGARRSSTYFLKDQNVGGSADFHFTASQGGSTIVGDWDGANPSSC